MHGIDPQLTVVGAQLRDTKGAKRTLQGVRPQPTHSLVVVPHGEGGFDVLGGTMGGVSVWNFPSASAESVSACPSKRRQRLGEG